MQDHNSIHAFRSIGLSDSTNSSTQREDKRCETDVTQARDICAARVGPMCNRSGTDVQQVRDKCARVLYAQCSTGTICGPSVTMAQGGRQECHTEHLVRFRFHHLFFSSLHLFFFSLRLYHSTLPLQQGTCTIMLFLCLTSFYDPPSHKTQAKVRDERLRENRNHREDETTSTNTRERTGEQKVYERHSKYSINPGE